MNIAAAKLRQVLSVIERVHSAHDAVNFEDLSEPALANRAKTELHCRIVPVHVTQLYGQIAPPGLIQHLLERAERFPARFVQVDVHAGVDAPPRDVHNAVIAGIDFHGHGLEALGAQQLLFGHPRQIPIGRSIFVPLAQLGIRLGDADDCVVVA